MRLSLPSLAMRHRAAGILLGGLLAAALAGGLATAQSWQGSQSEEELRYRLSVIDAEVQALKSQLGGDAATRGGGGGGSLGGDALVRLQRIEAELGRLTGEVERLGHRIDEIAEDATRRFGDIEFRLTELEGGDISAIGQTPPVGGAAAGGTGSGGGASSGGTAVASIDGPEVSVSERSDLDRAIRDVQQGRLDQAEDRLRGFLNDYPRSPLEAEARYWLGESQFVRGAFQEAARSYLDGYQVDRSGQAAAQNLLKLGVTLGRLGQVNEACLTLREVRSQFAGNDRVVSEAEGEAERLRCG